MSFEHIWPQSLGGAQSGALFKSNLVCKTCNNLAGLWVDGAFSKSWFMAQEVAQAARMYLDPEKPGVLPLIYMGLDEDFPNQAEHVCERWIGPAGEHIYHVHLADDDRWYGYAGGDIIRRKRRDAGRSYLVLTSQNSYWALTGLQSFLAHQKGARAFCLTQVEGMPPQFSSAFINLDNATQIEAAEIAWIRARPDDKMHNLRAPMRLDFSDRFLAKLSLGIGANLFGQSYSKSPYAEELRKLLWQRNAEGAEEPKVNGSSFWQESGTNDRFSSFLNLPGVWTILLQAQIEGFGLYVGTPSGRGMMMSLSDDNSFWSGQEYQSYQDGVVFLALPERQIFTGPIELPYFLAHKLGNIENPTLAALEKMKCDPASLPRPR